MDMYQSSCSCILDLDVNNDKKKQTSRLQDKKKHTERQLKRSVQNIICVFKAARSLIWAHLAVTKFLS